MHRLRNLIISLVVLSGMAETLAGSVQPVLPSIPSRGFDIQDYGGIGDGVATNTVAIQAAIDDASAAGGGIVVIPPGVFLCGPLHCKSRIDLRVETGAVLRMLPLDKYPGGTRAPENFLGGHKLHDVAISGGGTIDGQGLPWWPFAKVKDANRPRMIALSSCDRVLIEQVTLTNSPMFHIAIGGHSSNVTVRGVTIRAPASTDPFFPSHNTDACDVSGNTILIRDCDISVGDDNFTCGGGTSDVLITNCTYGYGHGVSIGSHTRGGVSNITVTDCVFNHTDCGIRIKSDRDRGGFVRNLAYLNLRMTNVALPILIYGSYAAQERQYRALQDLTPAVAAAYPAAPVSDSTPFYRDIVFSNVVAVAASGKRAGLIWGLPEAPVTNILLQKVRIRADRSFGVYGVQGVHLVNSEITTPSGIDPFSRTNTRITVDYHDVEYAVANGVSLRLDAMTPQPRGSYPVAVVVHGGGWSSGDKQDVFWKSLEPLLSAGFVSFSINYRLAPTNRWPACLEDVQAAIRWVKAHARQYQGDPQRVALFGYSAGGHLACLVGVLAREDTSVQAIVGFAPPTDLLADCERRGGVSPALRGLLNLPGPLDAEARATLRRISPVNHLKAGLPPFLLIHGTDDKSVPYSQSVNLQARLRDLGVRCDLVTLPGAPHNLAKWNQANADYDQKLLTWLATVFGASNDESQNTRVSEKPWEPARRF